MNTDTAATRSLPATSSWATSAKLRTFVITFALAMTLTLYSWLLTPLEDEH